MSEESLKRRETVDDVIKLLLGDIDLLRKGASLSLDRIAQEAGIDPKSSELGLFVLCLIDRLKRELRLRGKPWVVCQVNRCVRILEDREAILYSSATREQGVRKLIKANEDLDSVDTKKLSLTEHRTYVREKRVTTHHLRAIEEVRKELSMPARPARAIPHWISDPYESDEDD